MIRLPNGETSLSLGDLRAFVENHRGLSDRLPVTIDLTSEQIKPKDWYAYGLKIRHIPKSAINFEEISIECGKSYIL